MAEQFNVIDLFAGAGGFSEGFKQSGFKIVAALEKDEKASKTYAKNHPETLMIVSDIKDIKLFNNTIDVIIGGPPCQGFTKVKNAIDNVSIETKQMNNLYKEYVKIVESVNPKVFVMENVDNLVNFDKGNYLKAIYEDFSKLGYKIKHEVLNAADYGVPQDRKRTFVFGTKAEFDVIPIPPKLEVKLSVKEALKNISTNDIKVNEQARYIQLLKHILPGNNWESLPDDLKEELNSNTHSNILRRNDPDLPSWTIMGNYGGWVGPYHHEEIREYTIQEKAVLQGFRENYIFIGTKAQVKLMIGNAVPPPLAKCIAETVKQYLQDSFCTNPK